MQDSREGWTFFGSRVDSSTGRAATALLALALFLSTAFLFPTSSIVSSLFGSSYAALPAEPVSWLHNPNDGESTDLFMRLEATSEHAGIKEIVIVSGTVMLGAAELEPSEVTEFTIETAKLSQGVHTITGLYFAEGGQLVHVASVTAEIERPEISASAEVPSPSIAMVEVEVTTGPDVTQWCVVTGQASAAPVYSPYFERLMPLVNWDVAAAGALLPDANGASSFTVSVPVVANDEGKFPSVVALVYRDSKWVASRVVDVE